MSNDCIVWSRSEGNSNPRPGIKELLCQSKLDLLKYLFEISARDQQFLKNLYARDRHLKQEVDNGNVSEEEACTRFIKQFVDNELKFSVEEEIINRVDIKVDIYDVSDELLNENNDFNVILNQHGLIKIRDYSQGFGVEEDGINKDK